MGNTSSPSTKEKTAVNEITEYQRSILDHFTIQYDECYDGAEVLCEKCQVNLLDVIPTGGLGSLAVAAFAHWKYIHGPWPEYRFPPTIFRGGDMTEPQGPEPQEPETEESAEEAAEIRRVGEEVSESAD
jgi:hypothetical protein